MVFSIMELLTVFNAKINVINVLKQQIFVHLVTELIGFHGLHPIMIARKYYLILNLDAFKVISIIICLIAIYVNFNALHA